VEPRFWPLKRPLTPSLTPPPWVQVVISKQALSKQADGLADSVAVLARSLGPEPWHPASYGFDLTSLVGSVDGYPPNSCNGPSHFRRHLRRWLKLVAHFTVFRRLALGDDTQHYARNGLANTTNLVDCDWTQSNDGCFHGCVHPPPLSIGAVGSPLTPEALIEAYNTTEGLQKQGMRV